MLFSIIVQNSALRVFPFSSISSGFILTSSLSVICQTTGPKPLPKRFLHIVRSRASSFNWQYPFLSLRSSSSFLLLLPRLLLMYIYFFLFNRTTLQEPIRHVTKTWSVVLLNKKIHILLSQVYCVWQVVKTPTIISHNPVFTATGICPVPSWPR